MATLVLKFLGTFDAMLRGRRVQSFESSKVRALLAYLAIEGYRPLSRESLATLLWPESRHSRQNLRQALFNLRRVLGEGEGGSSFLVVTPQSVEFPRTQDVWVDVWEFESLIREAKTQEREVLSEEAARLLTRAVDLYKGDFLAGLHLRRAEPFEEWRRSYQEVLHSQYIEALRHLTAYYRHQGYYEKALKYVQIWRLQEPWSDEAAYEEMDLLALLEQVDAALEVYRKFAEYLRTEMQEEPSKQVLRLYRRLQKKREHFSPRWGDFADPWRQTRLPTFPTPFVGREKELEQIRARLLRPESRLQTIIGIGGMGKTRLAVEAGRRFETLFEDGVVFVPLDMVESAAFIPQAIANALGLFPSQSRSPANQVLDYLAEKEMLLILDNFEHVREGRRFLLQILSRAPGVRLLVTSRMPLDLRQEWRLPLDGLSCPSEETMERVREYEAVQLFLEDAQRLIPGFSPTPEEERIIARICSLVGGAPLAIELATALLPVYSLHTLAERIAQSLDVLATQMPDVPKRHRSLRAVFNQVWESLSDTERRAFRRLAVFQSEFSKEGAWAVAQTTEETLASLVHKSLLYKRDAPGGAHYRMHPVLRQYALEALYHDPRETREIRDRHVRYIFEVVKQAGQDMRGAREAEAFKLLRDLMPDVREAWQWALQQRSFVVLDEVLDILYWFYELYGGWEEGRVLFRQARKVLESVETSTVLPALGRIFGRVLMYEAWFVLRLSDVEQSRRLIEKGYALLQNYGHPADRAMALLVLGTVQREEGSYRDALQWLQEGQALYESLGMDFENAYALVLLAHVLDTLGEDMNKVEQLYTRALEIFRRLENPLGAAQALGSLGVVLYRRGDYQKAEKYLLEARHWWERLGAVSGMAVVLLNLGNVALFNKQYERARELFEQSATLYRRMGSRFGWAYAMHNLGEVHEWQGDIPAAREFYTKSLNVFRRLNHQWSIALTLSFLADTYVHTGEFNEARRLLVEALDIVQGLDVSPLRLRVLTSVGYYLLSKGQHEHARRLLSVVCVHTATDHELKERAHFLVKRPLERLGIPMPTPDNRPDIPPNAVLSLEDALRLARRLLSG